MLERLRKLERRLTPLLVDAHWELLRLVFGVLAALLTGQQIASAVYYFVAQEEGSARLFGHMIGYGYWALIIFLLYLHARHQGLKRRPSSPTIYYFRLKATRLLAWLALLFVVASNLMVLTWNLLWDRKLSLMLTPNQTWVLVDGVVYGLIAAAVLWWTNVPDAAS